MSARMTRVFSAAALMAGLLGAGSAHALTVYASLFGDPRAENPDKLRIDVVITASGSSAQWRVDINSPLHPNAKLGEFYFSMNGSVFGISNFSPPQWFGTQPASTVGGGNIDPTFMFEVSKQGDGNTGNVTNSEDLVFSMTKTSGAFTLADFTGAPQSCSSDKILGCGQLGAHLQSLTVPAGTTGMSDSGFLLGFYSDQPYPPEEIPIPAAAWLLGAGLMAMGAIGRRRVSARV